MFWLPDEASAEDIPRQCQLTWTRYENGGELEAADRAGEVEHKEVAQQEVAQQEVGQQEVEQIENVVWRTRGQAHYLTYEEPEELLTASSGQESVHLRTALRLEKSSLTWIRQGAVEWTHVFREGEEHVSRMRIAGKSVPIETVTSALEIDVQSNSGYVLLRYDMKLGENVERIETTLSFHETGQI